ncbi:MAG: hydroxymethylglutaryl-CoA lyase, partial [Actinophytocola sp.]|nr:hydroxymethylglutaryl-CoA lyase [Actinophytocola sp.]
DIRATVTLAVAFGCPFEGPVESTRALALAERMAAGGADEICFADTVGVGVPQQATELVSKAMSLSVPVGVHLHDTRNTGLANAQAAFDAGATIFDASVGGTGGCPFAPRATGNIATEDLVYALHGSGYETGIEIEALGRCAEWLAEQLGKDLPGMVHRAGGFEPVAA